MNPVDQSRLEADLARERLNMTFNDVRGKLTRQALMSDLGTAAKRQATKTAIVALSSSKVRPFVAAGVAATALAYLFRNPILKALNKRLGKGDTNDR